MVLTLKIMRVVVAIEVNHPSVIKKCIRVGSGSSSKQLNVGETLLDQFSTNETVQI